MKCSVEDCERKAITKSFCDMHYRRFRKNGDPLNPGSKIVYRGKTEKEKFDLQYEIKENGCWIWIGATRENAKGILYGRLGNEGAHRVSFRLHNGPIPDGLYACHKCDIPLCVNPNHLFLGTHEDNMKDMVEKERSYKGKGENKGVSKLSNAQAEQIRNSSLSQNKLAAIFGVSQTTVGRIKRGVTYNEF